MSNVIHLQASDVHIHPEPELVRGTLPVAFKKLTETALMPRYATELAAGADLHADEGVILRPGERKLVSTGIAIALPEGYEAQVRPRSGLAFKNGVTVLNAPGTVDADYRGELKVLLINHGTELFIAEPGDRIAQLVVAPVQKVGFVEMDELPSTERGEGGFGSTGVAA